MAPLPTLNIYADDVTYTVAVWNGRTQNSCAEASPVLLNDLEGLHPSADFRQMLGFALPLCFFYVSAANNELRWLC